MTDDQGYNGWKSMEQVRQANASLGHHWFEPSTLRFFNSRIGGRLYGGRYFISSERYNERYNRLYTVRIANSDGSIDTVGDFQGFKTRAQAQRHIQSLLSEQVEA